MSNLVYSDLRRDRLTNVQIQLVRVMQRSEVEFRPHDPSHQEHLVSAFFEVPEIQVGRRVFQPTLTQQQHETPTINSEGENLTRFMLVCVFRDSQTRGGNRKKERKKEHMISLEKDNGSLTVTLFS